MSEVTPEQILSRPTVPVGAIPPPAKSSIWMTIFWLVAFTPVGWYRVWKKTTWPVKVKLAIIIVTALLFLGLLVETELISSQITGQLTNLGV